MRGWGSNAAVARPRIVARLAASPVALLEAPSGSGKSVVLAQLADSTDLPAVWLEPREVGDPACLDAAAAGRPVLVLVDGAEALTPQAGKVLAAWLADVPEGVRAVVAGRRLGPELAGLATSGAVASTWLGMDALAFDADEIAAVLALRLGRDPTPEELDGVLAATGGWPAAATVAAERLAAGGTDALADREPIVGHLVDGLLAAADPDDRALVRQLLSLPKLSAKVAAAVGGDGALDRLLGAGIPVRFGVDGWGTPTPAVADALRQRAVPIPRAAMRVVAGHYADRGALLDAARLLHADGDAEGVVQLLDGRHRRELAAFGPTMLVALLDQAPDAVLADHPALLVEACRTLERDAALAGVLERFDDLLPDDTAARRAFDVECALALERAGDLSVAAEVAADVLAATEPGEVVTRGRAHLARGLAMLLRETATAGATCADDFAAAAALFQLGGEHDWEAYAHQCIGYGCHFSGGDLALAAERLYDALALLPDSNATRADVLTCAAEVLTHLGRLDDAAAVLREAGSIAARIGDERMRGYVAWSLAELHCQRRDHAAAEAALVEAERHPGEWLAGLAGVDFLAHASEIRLILGDVDGAAATLARAEAQAAGTERATAPMAARARFEATAGDPAAALAALDELDRDPVVYPRDRWLRALLRAVCAHRNGDLAGAARLLERAQREAEAIGDPDRIARREPELLRLLTGEVHATVERAPAATRVVLLDRFAVERNGVEITPPVGLPATLVKLLALRRTLAVDEAQDMLWPDADAATSRTRLRNLLNRLRSVSGPVVDREGDRLRLADGVDVDLDDFEAATAKAMAAPPAQRAGLARLALARCTGELLPGDLYADWAAGARERVRRRRVGLLDLLAEDAADRGHLDEAIHFLEEAIAIEPLDEGRTVRAMRLLLTQGQPGGARALGRRAMATADDLGVPIGPELEAMLTDSGPD